MCAGLRCILSLPWKHRSCRASVSFQIRTTVFVYTISFFPLKHRKITFFLKTNIALSRLRDKTDFPKNQCGLWVFNFQKRSGKVLLLGGQQRKMHKFTLAKVTHLACSIWLQQEPCTEIGEAPLQRFSGSSRDQSKQAKRHPYVSLVSMPRFPPLQYPALAMG